MNLSAEMTSAEMASAHESALDQICAASRGNQGIEGETRDPYSLILLIFLNPKLNQFF